MHHMLTRARGGLALDAVGETYHLLALCPRCHQVSHEDRENDTMIDGYVIDHGSHITYVGTNKYLRRKYGGDE